MQEKTLFSADKSYSQAYAFISDRLQKVKNTMNVIVQDKNLIVIVNKTTSDTDIFTQMDDMNRLTSFLDSLEDKTVVNKIRLYVQDGLIYANSPDNTKTHLYNLKDIEDTTWFQILEERDKRFLFCPSAYFEENEEADQTVSVISFLLSREDYSKSIGLIRIDINTDALLEIMANANTVESSVTYIQTESGIPVCSSNDLLETFIEPTTVVRQAEGPEWSTTNTAGGEKVFFRSQLIEKTDWYMVTFLPYDEIFSESKTLLAQTIITAMVLSFIVYLLAYVIATSITQRITLLINQMGDVHHGVLAPLEQSKTKDEIGELIQNYNYMISRIQLLLTEQFKHGKQVKNYELKVLQAQINPHFLYNTLDMVIYLAQENKYMEIEDSVKALAKFYRLSLSKGKEVIALEDELAHVSAYINIQNIRYENKIEFIIDIDDYLLEFSILKITLQPIVENAIIHGIQGKEIKEGTIVISGNVAGEDIVLSVSDDGIGIPSDKLKKIRSGNFIDTRGSNYGIKNINDRIQLYYGAGYGISFKSEYNVGTTVEIRIPAFRQI
jgi:two-component system sensor histidine kinase YesM